jgi:outer membrane biosynthesis protein TonB
MMAVARGSSLERVAKITEVEEKRMSQTKVFASMGKGAVGLLTLLLLFTLLLAGCGGEPTAVPTEPPQPTEVAAVAPTVAPTEPPPTPTEEPTAEPTPTEVPTEPPPTATPTEEPTPEPIDDTGCIACHTSDEVLQAMATEEEAPEVESEGEG